MLVRHAKSAWDDSSLADHDRPLAPRGRRALPLLVRHLASGVPPPDVVLCSSSRRTVETCAAIRPMLPETVVVEVDERLYGATAQELADRLSRLDGSVDCAMLIGHNPGLQDLAVALASEGDERALTQLERKFPTGAAVTISFRGDWGELAAGSGRVDDLFMPRRPRT